MEGLIHDKDWQVTLPNTFKTHALEVENKINKMLKEIINQ